MPPLPDPSDRKRPLETVIADWREHASVCRKLGLEKEAVLVDRLVSEIAIASEDFTTFLSEADAIKRSGKAERWLRQRFHSWVAEGNARMSQRFRREYRQCVIPQRTFTSTAAEMGRRAGEQARRSA